MSGDAWRIWYSGVAYQVAGFSSAGSARRHAKKHFLASDERWAEVGSAPAPAELTARLQAGEPEQEVLEVAAAAYLDAVRRNTIPQRIQKAATGRHATETGFEVPALMVVTTTGIYCAFARADVSHLATAYRPVPRGCRGSPRMADYVDAAKRCLAREVR